MILRASAIFYLVLVGATGCRTAPPQPTETITVVAAASLGPALEAVRLSFMSAHPNVDVHLEFMASRTACRAVTDHDRLIDVVLVADAELVMQLLMPDDAAFNIVFAGNALVLAYPHNGPVAAELQRGLPWQRVLRDKRLGYANPALAPLGTRTRMALALNDLIAEPSLRLGQQILAGLRPADERPDAAQLIGPLESGAFDAAFLYASDVTAHALDAWPLDPRIDFSDPARDAFYARAAVTLPGVSKPVRGRAATYSVTLLRAAPHKAAATLFVQFLLSPQGAAAAQPHLSGYLPTIQRRFEGDVPQALRGQVS